MGGTARKALTYSFLTIGGYLVLKNYAGFGSNVKAATGGAVNVIKAFQARP